VDFAYPAVWLYYFQFFWWPRPLERLDHLQASGFACGRGFLLYNKPSPSDSELGGAKQVVRDCERNVVLEIERRGL